MGLCKLLDCRKLDKLSKVDDIDCLDGKNYAPSSITLSSSERVSSLIKFEAREHHVEGLA